MTTKREFRLEFRGLTDYSERVLSNAEFETVLNRAQKHIRAQKGLDAEFGLEDFLSDPNAEEALFWWTCLFAKLSTGELDAQELQVGAVDQDALLAKDDNSVTEWYRNARGAMRSFQPDNVFTMAFPTRENRVYEDDDESSGLGSGGLTDGL